MVALRGTTKSRTGIIRAPVNCGGVTVELGDWVVGDADGVVVVPETTLADVINAGRVRASKEAGMFRSLWEGRTTVDLLGLDPSPIQERDS
jgi:4-hydroxy-4-methyl-2-oxoglutarate aldolase